jgi:hypothetical protein
MELVQAYSTLVDIILTILCILFIRRTEVKLAIKQLQTLHHRYSILQIVATEIRNHCKVISLTIRRQTLQFASQETTERR